MNENEQDNHLWKLVREGTPLPEPPAWFTAKTVARLRQERSKSPFSRFWQANWRAAWIGALAFGFVCVTSIWQYDLKILHEREVILVAQDEYNTGEVASNQDDVWSATY